jgi:hypothetical protein
MVDTFGAVHCEIALARLRGLSTRQQLRFVSSIFNMCK